VGIGPPGLVAIAAGRGIGRILGRQPATRKPEPVPGPQPDDLATKRIDRRSQVGLFRRYPGCLEKAARATTDNQADQCRRHSKKATHDRDASDQRASVDGSPPPFPAMLLPM
jgi:hypothetical protein